MSDLMVGKNGVDPLTKVADTEHELFKRFSDVARGFPLEAVLGAALNMILNALRQSYKTRKSADDALVELHQKSRSMLSDHFDHRGERRSVFPFHQIIELPDVIRFSNKFKGR